MTLPDPTAMAGPGRGSVSVEPEPSGQTVEPCAVAPVAAARAVERRAMQTFGHAQERYATGHARPSANAASARA